MSYLAALLLGILLPTVNLTVVTEDAAPEEGVVTLQAEIRNTSDKKTVKLPEPHTSHGRLTVQPWAIVLTKDGETVSEPGIHVKRIMKDIKLRPGETYTFTFKIVLTELIHDNWQPLDDPHGDYTVRFVCRKSRKEYLSSNTVTFHYQDGTLQNEEKQP